VKNPQNKTKIINNLKPKKMNISKIQLFVLLQDTVCHLKTGNHLARNYHHVKQQILSAFNYPKNTPSLKLLVCIGHVYCEVVNDRETFQEYISKNGLIEKYNTELDRIATD
jgi:hypothetical protein